MEMSQATRQEIDEIDARLIAIALVVAWWMWIIYAMTSPSYESLINLVA
jgi:hypothetical protein